MVEIVKGDILYFAKHVEAVVDPVNCVGVSGAGLALDFKREWPEPNIRYESACLDRRIRIGKVLVVPRLEGVPVGRKIPNPGFIIYFPTKNHWRDRSSLFDIELGLHDLVVEVMRLDIRSLAIPALGCGLELLEWPIVRSLVKLFFNHGPMEDVRVCLFDPSSATTSRPVPSRDV